MLQNFQRSGERNTKPKQKSTTTRCFPVPTRNSCATPAGSALYGSWARSRTSTSTATAASSPTRTSRSRLAAIAIGYKRIIEGSGRRAEGPRRDHQPHGYESHGQGSYRRGGARLWHAHAPPAPRGVTSRAAASAFRCCAHAHTAIWSAWWRSTARTNNATGDGSHAAIDGQHARHPPSALYRYDDALRGYDLRSLGHRRSRSAALHLLPCGNRWHAARP